MTDDNKNDFDVDLFIKFMKATWDFSGFKNYKILF